VDDAAMRRAIATKRDGGALDGGDWAAAVEAYLAGIVDDAQMAALLMAVTIRGLEPAETTSLIRAFVASGSLVPPVAGAVDKHSSGGVADSVSLVVVPWVAACGVPVAKLSGRALGHTGGTLDKLEAVPGVSTQVPLARFRAIVEEVGCAIAAQTAELVPADRRIYALRDRTSTVPEPGLIAASIVSKKIAGGAEGIAYDIKAGAGAFLREPAAASALARTIVAATASFGRRAIALVTDMHEPLGLAIGSGLETIEARDVLRGAAGDPRLLEACRTIADAMLRVAGRPSLAMPAARAALLDRTLASGAAFERLERLLAALGAERGALEALAPCAEHHVVRTARAGVVTAIDPVALGFLARALTQRHGPLAGLIVAARTGDRLAADAPVATVYGGAWAVEPAAAAFAIGETAPPARPLVLAEIASEDSAARP